MFELKEISAIAQSGYRIELDDDKDGLPVLQKSSKGFKGMVLGFLGNIPWVKDLSVVTKYAESVRVGNARVLGVFIQALARRYGNAAAEQAIFSSRLDLTGNTPLTSRTIKDLTFSASAAVTNLPIWRSRSPESPSICGFKNFGKTCYANSILKFLILSIGPERLVAHLKELQLKTEDQGKKGCAIVFIDLIKKSLKQSNTVENELGAFFEGLQKQPVFNSLDENGKFIFKLIDGVNEAQDFLEKISDFFRLKDIDGFSVFLGKGSNYYECSYNNISQQKFCQSVTVDNENINLQELLGKIIKDEPGVGAGGFRGGKHSAESDKEKTLVVDNIESFERLNVNVNVMKLNKNSLQSNKLMLRNIYFNDLVRIPIFDKLTNRTWMVNMEPQEVVVHQESINSGHYFTYSKLEGNQGWVKHDDRAALSPVRRIPDDEQPKLISFAFVSRRTVD